MRIDVRKQVKRPPDRVYRVYSLEYKIRVDERVYEGLRLKSRRPHTVHRVSQEVLDEAIRLRRSYGWNSKKISIYLQEEGKMEEEGKMVSESTVEREIRRRELNQPLKKKRRQHKCQ